ncbi:hypothetical protein AJ89_10530 [Lactococcus cremoris subsp. cremoris IBB477]|uniref:Uncharacterized protein n=1 Tax=Lactococcus cremoris subsp. cremoris IBB477 TaxID=1449093 RepID=A0A1E7G284_LACLC|nr:hypothetical protein AJ89_10530 [Lactococcus cremoris subsp. cremoris IBB477]
MKIKVETKKQIVLKCKSVFVWANFITPIQCSENGPFSEHSSFVIKTLKIIYISCSLTRNLFYVHLYIYF